MQVSYRRNHSLRSLAKHGYYRITRNEAMQSNGKLPTGGKVHMGIRIKAFVNSVDHQSSCLLILQPDIVFNYKNGSHSNIFR